MPKSWSKGLTAATDPRVARNAARHRGLQYVRRTPPGLWKLKSLRTLPLEWSNTMAYVVGLIATDGCLINTGRHIGFVTEDRQLMETYLDCLGRPPRYRIETTPKGALVYRVTHGDVAMYRWLMTIGLMQRKSLVLGAIDVPDEHLASLTRGLLDGDGSIINKVSRADTKDSPNYRWEYLQTKFLSASWRHIEWLQRRLKDYLGVDGYAQRYRTGIKRTLLSELRYGKRESLILLPTLYPHHSVPRLMRKWQIWDAYIARDRASALGIIGAHAQVE